MSSVQRAFAQKLSKWVGEQYSLHFHELWVRGGQSKVHGSIGSMGILFLSASPKYDWICVLQFSSALGLIFFFLSYWQTSCIGRTKEYTKLSLEWYVKTESHDFIFCTMLVHFQNGRENRLHSSVHLRHVECFIDFSCWFRFQRRVKVVVPLDRLR